MQWKSLTRQVSVFAFTGKAKEVGDHGDLPLDEGRMEQAMMKTGGRGGQNE
jgi:hypothetical protein